MSYAVARCFGRGLYFARKVVQWELQWMRGEKIEEGKQGCFTKTSSWFDDEGVQLAVREWLAGAGEGETKAGSTVIHAVPLFMLFADCNPTRYHRI
jgi:hypothetical protein